jgi:hypothetical protein
VYNVRAVDTAALGLLPGEPSVRKSGDSRGGIECPFHGI